MKKYIIGIIAGIITGGINCLFLLMAEYLEITVFISTFVTWIVIGLFICASDFKVNSIIKGIIISLLVSLSSLVYTVSSTITGAIWTIFTTIIFGAILGYIIEKINERKN